MNAATHQPNLSRGRRVGSPGPDGGRRGAGAPGIFALTRTQCHGGYARRIVLADVRGGKVELDSLLGDGPVLLVFVHGDCPTSVLALRHLAAVGQSPWTNTSRT